MILLSTHLSHRGELYEMKEIWNLTFPAPEQLGHLSVCGVDKGWVPLLAVEAGSAKTSAPVLEQRAHARYPAYDIGDISDASWGQPTKLY